jgi:hypothetical protein
MSRFSVWIGAAALVLAGLAGCFAAAAEAPAPDVTLAEIIERNIAARGGVDAWRKIDTMVWIGHVESSNAPATGLPFRLDMMRPNKSHFELVNGGLKAVRIFDGKQGWKLRPAQGGGKPEVQDYSADERRYSRDEQVIDGLLIDHLAKGHVVTFEARDEVEGRAAYRLGVALPSGALARVWVDAQRFLEVKLERRSDRSAAVAVIYRDYREVEGLQIPGVIETSRSVAGQFDRLVIERVSLNPLLPASDFTKPGAAPRRGQAVVDTRSAASSAVTATR